MSQYPAFQFGKSRFDQDTFSGRFRHFLDVIDPSTLFVSEKRLQESIDLLNRFKQGTLPPGVTNEQLWKAQKIKQAIIHPDTGEKILMPFRMSGFVPFGTPVVVGLLLPNQTLMSTIFWQWLNQSHNACVNYSNRNASRPAPTTAFVYGYLGAVTSAVSIAVGLNVLIQRARSFSPTTRLFVQRFIPFPAVASANVCNVVLMRRSELSAGISVLDDTGNVVGTSRVAARHTGSRGQQSEQAPRLPTPQTLPPALPEEYRGVPRPGTFRDRPDPSRDAHAHPGASSDDHGCIGKTASPAETAQTCVARPCVGLSRCLWLRSASRHQPLPTDVSDQRA